jgi:hypothetical protein
MRSFRLAVVFVCSLGFSLALPSVARAQTDLVGARAMGMGEALRAMATGATGPLLNPAGMSLMKQYVIEAQYGIRAEDLNHHVFLGIVDSVTAKVGAGLYYSFIYGTPKLGFNWAGGQIDSAQLTRTGHVAGLALSLPFGDKFMIGLTTKYMKIDTTAPLPKGTNPSTLTLDAVNGVTFDFGALLHLGKFNLAAVAYNLWDHGSRETPMGLGIGIGFAALPSLSINVDAVINFTGNKYLKIDEVTGTASFDNRTTVRVGPGLEWLIKGKVPLRLGYTFDSALLASYLSAGLGYMSQSFAIDASYRGKVDGGIENSVMIGLRIFIH